MIEIAPRTFQVEGRDEADRALANEIVVLVRAKPDLVLGLATGTTPVGVYRELVRLVGTGELDLARVRTFNLDEYLGLERNDPAAFRARMQAMLFGPARIPLARTDLPACDVQRKGEAAECERYERAIEAAGGIDLQLLGIGRNGHIGFNEPGSERATRTRIVELDATTREDAAAAFGGLERVPRRAITVGIATILAARRLRVLAFGPHKASIVRATLEGPICTAVPASFLREHSDVEFWLDRDAARELVRVPSNRV